MIQQEVGDSGQRKGEGALGVKTELMLMATQWMTAK